MTALGQIPADMGVYNERLAIVLGFITFILMMGTLLSCRSFLALLDHLRWNKIAENRVYRAFYNAHPIFWWGFALAIILHLLVGIMHIGFIDPTDPDAYLHTYVLWAGVSAFIVTVIIYSSCRAFSGVLNLATGKNPLSNKLFGTFYRFHDYYWIALLAIVVLHFIFSYLHTGIWA